MPSIRTRLALILLILIACCRTVSAADLLPMVDPGQVGLSEEKLSSVTEAVEALVDGDRVAGAMVAVARRGQVAYIEPFGKMDIDEDEPMRRDAVFRIYSMTKPITTVAAMILWEEGRFKLDDPVSNYLPEFKGLQVYSSNGSPEDLQPCDRKMTIRDLMRHTSGLTYGIFGDTPVDRRYREKNVLDRESTLAAMTQRLGTVPLLHQPGTKFHYSVSTDVLGRVVEVIAQQPLDRFFRRRIFRPLGMTDTGFVVPRRLKGRFTATHGREDGELVVSDAAATSLFLTRPVMFSGGGGLVSTIDDYMRFCLMLAGGDEYDGPRILKEETVRLMARNHLPDQAPTTGNPGVGFGLGFSVRTADVIGEYGWGGAASTHFWISPKHELVVIAMQQFMPFNGQLESTVKPLVYDAIVD